MTRLAKSASTMVRARRLRADMTDAERILWMLLRSRRFAGVKFRRQAPLGDYVVDFVCLPVRLVVELDGAQHASKRISMRGERHIWKRRDSVSCASGLAIYSRIGKAFFQRSATP